MNSGQNLEFLRKKASRKFIIALMPAVICYLIFFTKLGGDFLKNCLDDTFIEKIGKSIFCICAPILPGMMVAYALINALAFDSIKRFKDVYRQTIVRSTLIDIFNGRVVRLPRKSYDTMANINDHFVGEYKDVRFKFNEGVFEFEFNKPFQQILQISERGFRNRSIWLTDLTQLKTLKKIKVEDVEFNKKFAIYAQNEEEAFYMLTPNFIQGIKKLRNMKNTRLDFQFEDKYLRITVVNFKNWFEGKLFKRIINESDARESVMQDIKFITDFVDELSLDNDLFKKEISEYDERNRRFRELDKKMKSDTESLILILIFSLGVPVIIVIGMFIVNLISNLLNILE